MMKNLLLTALVVAALSLVGCKSSTTVSDEYASVQKFEVVCLGSNHDGTQTLRSWGKGSSKSDAIENAKRNAVETVIFKGINSGGDCDKRPLVNQANARELYEDYFNAFFKKGGAYAKYVKLDEKRTSRINASGTSQEAWGVVLTVDRAALKKRLADDNLIDL